jgi:hypothetical protein
MAGIPSQKFFGAVLTVVPIEAKERLNGCAGRINASK